MFQCERDLLADHQECSDPVPARAGRGLKRHGSEMDEQGLVLRTQFVPPSPPATNRKSGVLIGSLAAIFMRDFRT